MAGREQALPGGGSRQVPQLPLLRLVSTAPPFRRCKP
jgi:hypothetical protein